jgi:hypothetical protein
MSFNYALLVQVGILSVPKFSLVVLGGLALSGAWVI